MTKTTKKLTALMLAIIMMLVACGGDGQLEGYQDEYPNEYENGHEEIDQENIIDVEYYDEPFEGKIAFITHALYMDNLFLLHTIDSLREEFGEDKIIHRLWPLMFAQEQDMMITIAQEVASDPDVSVVIFCYAVRGSIIAADAILEMRDDLFLVFINPGEDPLDVTQRANLTLQNGISIFDNGAHIVRDAHAMGAEAFVHYSGPRSLPWMSANRRDAMQLEAERLGMTFIDAAIPDTDTIFERGLFILEDVPLTVARYGTDTAFYVTGGDGDVLARLIASVLDTGAILAPPCCHPIHEDFLQAVGLPLSFNDNFHFYDSIPRMNQLIEEAVAQRSMTGRLANWAVDLSTFNTLVAFEYAVKWLNNEVPQEGICHDTLLEIATDRAEAHVYLEFHEEEGVYLDNIIRVFTRWIMVY